MIAPKTVSLPPVLAKAIALLVKLARLFHVSLDDLVLAIQSQLSTSGKEPGDTTKSIAKVFGRSRRMIVNYNGIQLAINGKPPWQETLRCLQARLREADAIKKPEHKRMTLTAVQNGLFDCCDRKFDPKAVRTWLEDMERADLVGIDHREDLFWATSASSDICPDGVQGYRDITCIKLEDMLSIASMHLDPSKKEIVEMKQGVSRNREGVEPQLARDHYPPPRGRTGQGRSPEGDQRRGRLVAQGDVPGDRAAPRQEGEPGGLSRATAARAARNPKRRSRSPRPSGRLGGSRSGRPKHGPGELRRQPDRPRSEYEGKDQRQLDLPRS